MSDDKDDRPFERYSSIIPDYDAFCDAVRESLPVTAWCNPERTTREELCKRLREDGFEPHPLTWYPSAIKLPFTQRIGKHWLFLAGHYQIQEEAAMLPVRMLDVKPGECVLDLCAAPGNKTAQLAFDMQQRGSVYANELNKRRVASLRETVERLGLRNVSILQLNGTNIPKTAAKFDHVLVDVPCTCEGTTRKNPYIEPTARVEESQRLNGLQEALLRKAIQLCKAGGRVVYATCTYAPEENESILNRVMAEYPDADLRVVPAAPEGLMTSPGITEWEGENFPGAFVNCVRLWPHQNDTGGFFAAVVEKGRDPDEEDFEPERTLPEETADCRAWLLNLAVQYGFSSSLLKNHRIFYANARESRIIADDHTVFRKLKTARRGLQLLSHKRDHIKPVHSGALLFGSRATRNFVTLKEDQLRAYMCRENLCLDHEQIVSWDGKHEVLVKYEGCGIGVGELQETREGCYMLKSRYPKRLSRRLQEKDSSQEKALE